MKKTAAAMLLPFMACLTMPAPANAQDSAVMSQSAVNAVVKRAKLQWQDRRFRDSYSTLVGLRGQPYTRRADIDFMLATSACQIGLRDFGKAVLVRLLQSYPLDPRSNTVVAQQLRRCAPNDQPIILISTPVFASSGGYGKYYLLEAGQPAAIVPALRKRTVPEEVIAARLFERVEVTRGATDDQTSFASPEYEEYLRGQGCVSVGRRYIGLCSFHPALSTHDLEKMAREVDRFVEFMRTEFSIAPPDNYLTIRIYPSDAYYYGVEALLRKMMNVKEEEPAPSGDEDIGIPALQITPYTDQFVGTALELHGLEVPFTTLGYAYVDDMSISVRSDGGTGSIFHEIVHLSLRRDFGDAPQWLEEGLASLYEASYFCDGKYYGIDNWRGLLLAQPGAHVSVSSVDDAWKNNRILDIVKGRWAELPEAIPDKGTIYGGDLAGFVEDRGGREAKMRYLMLMLQEEGMDSLKTLYAGLRDTKVEEDIGAASAKAIDEHLVHGPLAGLDPALRYFVNRAQNNFLLGGPEECREARIRALLESEGRLRPQFG